MFYENFCRAEKCTFIRTNTANALTFIRTFIIPGKEDAPETHHGFKFSPRSLFIGMVHGFAGSAALMLAIIPTINRASSD